MRATRIHLIALLIDRLGPFSLLGHGDEEAALTAFHEQDDRVLVFSLGEGIAHLLHRLHGLAVHLANEVATLQARMLRRAARLDADDHYARGSCVATVHGVVIWRYDRLSHC
jgi:hypothetical protein